ncbi:TIGR04282 family arsenosugar biosynthesis glycosyltransferase [Owenweeksia hongkongensis]|uniref:TIGR04282 family arsenosugar biosynthesis glycosyltransferase n=1 Tax=Owenweeksia hongkongensis TaxID=253245 RepID=UPI003A909597
MSDQFSNTAILIFSRSAKAESLEKKIFSSQRRRFNRTIFQSLLDHSLHTAKDSQLPVFWIDENKQRGSNFGERFANAFEYVFSQGYDNVISIGNDTPELTSADLLQAAKILNQQKSVLGPTADGGDYLIGLNKSAFCKEPFQNIPWQTSAVHESLARYFKAFDCSTALLHTLVDVDHESVIWESSTDHGKLQSLKLLLLKLLDQTIFTLVYRTPHTSSPSLFQKGLRAPPSFS